MFDNNVIWLEKKTGTRFMIHRDDFAAHLEDYALTADDVELLPLTEATPQEMASAIGEEMENANHHSLTSLAEDILDAVIRDGFDEAQQRTVLRAVISAVTNFV